MARYTAPSRLGVRCCSRRQFQSPCQIPAGGLEIFLFFVDIMPQWFLLCHSVSPRTPQLGIHCILGALRSRLDVIFLFVRSPLGFSSVPGPNQSKNEKGRDGNLTENCNWSHLPFKAAGMVSWVDKEVLEISIRCKGARHDWSGTPSVPWELSIPSSTLESLKQRKL